MPAKPLSVCERFNLQAKRADWPSRCDDTLAFDNARLKDLVGVWQAARGARDLPMRVDFSARALIRHLRDIAFQELIQEPGAPRRFRFGFFGSALAHYAGDCTGKSLDEIIPAQHIASWYGSYDAAFEQRAPLRFVSQFRSLNLDYLTAESFIAPLGDAGGVPCGLLTSVAYTPRVS
ncbi:MAG TPA: PAS domain-containing protein [Rhizomicrobium sp.]